MRCSRTKLYPKRRFSQNFLKHENSLRRIVEFAQIDNETVLEIGAGKGSLTKRIAEKAKRVFAIEIDQDLVAILADLGIPNVTVIKDDFLKIDLKEFEQPVIIGNIPYSITTQILKRLVEQRNAFKKSVLTIQKEYGDRILAKPGDVQYGFISLYVNYYFHAMKGFVIPARFFSPKPKVDSVTIVLEKKEPAPFLDNERAFFDFVQGIFRYRRKSVKNSVRHFTGRLPRDIDEQVLRKRPQELSLEDFNELYQHSKA